MKKNKKDLYCVLGAEKFQQVVFKLERLKYKIIEKYFPSIREINEKISDKRFQKRLKKEPIEKQQYLLAEHQNQKLIFRKELTYKQNVNYHYNVNHPTRFLKYLEWNKKVHIRGMKKSIFILIGTIGLTCLLGNPFPLFSMLLIGGNMMSLIINFECVNLQNYNLVRFKQKETYALLKKIEEKKQKENLEKLGESIEPVSKVITNQVELPTINQVVKEITTIEQTRQLLEYVKEQYQYMKNTEEQRRR